MLLIVYIFLSFHVTFSLYSSHPLTFSPPVSRATKALWVIQPWSRPSTTVGRAIVVVYANKVFFVECIALIDYTREFIRWLRTWKKVDGKPKQLLKLKFEKKVLVPRKSLIQGLSFSPRNLEFLGFIFMGRFELKI